MEKETLLKEFVLPMTRRFDEFESRLSGLATMISDLSGVNERHFILLQSIVSAKSERDATVKRRLLAKIVREMADDVNAACDRWRQTYEQALEPHEVVYIETHGTDVQTRSLSYAPDFRRCVRCGVVLNGGEADDGVCEQCDEVWLLALVRREPLSPAAVNAGSEKEKTNDEV